MTTSNTEVAEHGLRELTTGELDEVSGGLFPLLVMAFAVGFDAGFIGVMAFSDLD
jgi:lactobin A/cerein 7B family class IIb bacteriocin